MPQLSISIRLLRKSFAWITGCLAFVSFSAAMGQSPSILTQKLLLGFHDASVVTVFSRIESASDVRFSYNRDDLDMSRKISLPSKERTVAELLNELGSQAKLEFSYANGQVLVKPDPSKKTTGPKIMHDDLTVTGRVTAATGEPLPGVTIKVRGMNIGTVTDAEGNFSLSVPDTAVLIISYIGYETREVPVKGQSNLAITLNPVSTGLSQLVVIGYGIQKKIDVTGAVASVAGTELVKQPVLTATQAIQGKVAGVQIISSGQPGSSPQVRIRGTGTMLAGANPLYVVDGVITDDITNINTADIVSVDVLKDASSEAIYGVRAANGVIIITTRQGKEGKMQVSYNGNVGVRMAANLVKMADAHQYLDYEQAALGPQLNPTKYSTNWYDQILRKAIEQNHNVSLSGGTEKTRYFLSLGYLSDQGIVIDNVYKRFDIRSNNEFDLAKGLKLGLQSSYSNANARNVNLGTAYNNAYRAAPLIPAIIAGKYGNTSLFQNVGNPILDIRNNHNKTFDNRLQGAAYLEYKPVSWLTLKSSLGGDLDNNNNRAYNYQFNSDTSTFITPGGNQSNSLSNLSMAYSKLFHWVWDNTATLNKQFGKNGLTVLVGTTAEQLASSFLSGSRKNVPADPNLWYLQAGDQNTQVNNSGGDKWARNSYLGRVHYSFDEKYLVTATFRADASSRFPARNRWGYFPSIGGAWLISREAFMQNQQAFQVLKLRGSWGRVGNDNIPSDAFGITLTPNLPYFFGGGGTPGSAITQIKDQNLKWETTEEADMGIEFSAIKDKLSGEFDYYNKTTKDALIYVLIPATLGSQPNPNSSIPAGYVLTNAASIRNNGVELALKWNDKLSGDFSYFIGANITFNHNDVIGLNGGQPYIDGSVGANQPYVTRTDNGHPIGSFYVQKVLGVFKNQAEIDSYTDGNGKMLQPDAQPGDFKYEYKNGRLDSVFAGSYQPVAYYGISGGLNYKNLDFSVDCYGNYGNKVYNGKKGFRQSVLDNVEAATAENRWTAAKPSATEPRANGGDLPASTYFVESGSFFRINNVTLGYSLREDMLKKTKFISSVRIYFTSQNTLTIKKYSGFTAELPGTPTNAGIELNAYPTSRTFALGLNIGF